MCGILNTSYFSINVYLSPHTFILISPWEPILLILLGCSTTGIIVALQEKASHRLFLSEEETKTLDQRRVWQLLTFETSCWSSAPSMILPMKNAVALPVGPHPTGSSYLWFHWNETVGSSARENWPFNRPAMVEVVIVLQGPDLQRQWGKNKRKRVSVWSPLFSCFSFK